ncbi:hypothetical protein CURTO8I2_300004 [Curtobacterium sp. 8I-2]|nr:hypothetical protein CURTO8I2_300004 [Curtobacterium sp. 8I-2]
MSSHPAPYEECGHHARSRYSH